MIEPLAQQMLDLIFHDPTMQRRCKDALGDWILDTQSRTAPLSATSLIEYLSVSQPHLLNRLKSNVRIQDELARALECVESH